MTILYTFERDRITGMTEGEHSAPILTAVAEPTSLETEVYFYRAAFGQPAGPGRFLKLPKKYWPNRKTPLYVLLDRDIDYNY